MFFTRFRINTARRDARALLGSPHRMHGAVTMSFPDTLPRDGDGPRVLWRVDRDSAAQTLLYIVSPTRPDLTGLVEQAGWPAADGPGWQTYDYGAFLDGLTAGSVWSFRLTANPVHSIRRTDDEPTKRTAHLTPRHQQRWLLDRQRASGFSVVEKSPDRRLLEYGDELQLLVRDKRDLRFAKAAERRTVSLVSVTYDGRLTVTDPDVLRRTLTQGLGKAKAYGCGLMTLAPVR
ncbi:type I-E CRISPR-associated protein Cas6/Cse3/CasE [Actinacidiphila sp. ITFR-21]|uniref:type I-E CRISPR-associated protein Cas6/Cse3/CasE n=1 Tax=Actinacidiphila sp. ITFR-21 TaxID=3075199 RepID=UPI00288AA854|nr:type I-E CRISPR-associated protein Cas6/Cse3/CasE [Streptomyces sp. ITFR-21]WNI16529.1 type I-E CRISPR-associated protein Cas6/Cse3/CasE [Streptomyces sp. ITFR-21]